MALPTIIEKDLLDSLHAQAEQLMNGKRGDIDTLCDVVAKTAKVVVARARAGTILPEECVLTQRTILNEVARVEQAMIARVESEIGRTDYKSKLAVVVPICLTFAGIAIAAFALLK